MRVLYELPESLPVLIPAIHTEGVVGCIGGIGDSEHVPLWFRCREGFLCRCGECDQIFRLVRVLYELPKESCSRTPSSTGATPSDVGGAHRP